MLQSTLLAVKKKMTNSSKINEKRIDTLIDNMKYWEIGEYIYPNHIKAIINAEYNIVYDVLNEIKNLGILEYRFEIYCNICNKFIEKPPLKSLNEFPKEFYCDENHKLNPIDNTILIYKVVSNV